MTALIQARPFEQTGAPSRGEVLTWGGLLMVAFLSRVVGLGDPPLSSEESRRALEGWTLWREGRVAYSGGPLMTNLSSLLIGLFSAGDGQARLISTLAGSGTVMVLWLLRPALGARGAWCAAAVLAACSPLVTASRTVSPAMLVAFFLLLTAACAYRFADSLEPRWLTATAVGLLLGLAADPSFVVGLLGLILAVALAEGDLSARPRWWRVLRVNGPRAIGMATIAALVMDTRLLMNPTGIQAGLIDPLWQWSRDVVLGSGLRGPLLLLLVDGGTLALAAIGLADYRRHERAIRVLAAWTVIAVTLTALVRQSDLRYLVQPLIPAALLGGLGLRRLVEPVLRHFSVRSLVAALLALAPLVTAAFQINTGLRNGQEPWPVAGLIVALSLPLSATVARHSLGAREYAAAVSTFGLILLCLWSTTTTSRLLEARGGLRSQLLDELVLTDGIRVVRQEALKWWRADSGGTITVDPTLRPLVAWALRDVPTVRYDGTDSRQSAPRLRVETSTAVSQRDVDTTRLVVGYGADRSTLDLTPARVWRWIVKRENLAEIRAYAILIDQPAGE